MKTMIYTFLSDTDELIFWIVKFGQKLGSFLMHIKMSSRCVKGLHVNMVITKRNFKTLLSLILGPYLPFLVGFTREDVRRLFPFFEKNVWEMLRESGYLHIQATKPDTAGGDTHTSLRKKVKVDLSVHYSIM